MVGSKMGSHDNQEIASQAATVLIHCHKISYILIMLHCIYIITPNNEYDCLALTEGK